MANADRQLDGVARPTSQRRYGGPQQNFQPPLQPRAAANPAQPQYQDEEEDVEDLDDDQQGEVGAFAGAQQALSDAKGAATNTAEKLGGRWVIDFLLWSDIEFIPGALYAAPLLTIYMIVGLFTSNPFWHQLKTWEKMVIFLIDLLLFMVVVAAIALVSYACSGTSGTLFKAIGSLGSWTAAFGPFGAFGAVCKNLPNI